MEEIIKNFKNKKEINNVKIDLWYNPSLIQPDDILHNLFKSNNLIIRYENNLKNKITGVIKILSDEEDKDFKRNNNIYNKLSLNINFVYDRSVLDDTMYFMGLEDRIKNNSYYGLYGVDQISINCEFFNSTLVNL